MFENKYNCLRSKHSLIQYNCCGFLAFVIPSHKRFLEMDGKKSQSFFALQNAKRNEKRKELQKQKTQKQESSFSMYRKYRTGDFPDIEISYSSVIKTLQAMAKVMYRFLHQH